MAEETEIKTSTLTETTNFIAWKAEEPDGEVTYHLELGTVTLHFFFGGVEGVARSRPIGELESH